MRALLLAFLLVVAGCMSPIGADGVPTPSGPCEAADVPAPPINTAGNVTARPYPEIPAEWTKQTVRSYVESYERALQHNRALAKRPTTVELRVGVSGVTVERHGDTFVVRLESFTQGMFAEEGEEGSPSYIAWDEVPAPATYLVTGTRLVRAEGDVGPDGLREGTTLECF